MNACVCSMSMPTRPDRPCVSDGAFFYIRAVGSGGGSFRQWARTAEGQTSNCRTAKLSDRRLMQDGPFRDAGNPGSICQGRSACAPGAGAIFWLHRRRLRASQASRTTSGCRDGGVIRNDPLQRGNMMRRPACHDAMAGLFLRKQFLIWWNMDSGPTLNLSVGGAVSSGTDWPWSAS